MPGNATTFEFLSNNGVVTNVFLPLILIGVTLIAITVLLNISADLKKYRRFMKLFKYLSKSFSYCAYGMLTVAIIGLPVFLAYNLVNVAAANPEGTGVFLKYVGIIIGAFIGFTCIGYLTKNRVWKNLSKFYKNEKQLKEVKGVNYERKTKA